MESVLSRDGWIILPTVFLDVSKWQEILSVRASNSFLNFLAELNKIRQHLIIRKHKSDRRNYFFLLKNKSLTSELLLFDSQTRTRVVKSKRESLSTRESEPPSLTKRRGTSLKDIGFKSLKPLILSDTRKARRLHNTTILKTYVISSNWWEWSNAQQLSFERFITLSLPAKCSSSVFLLKNVIYFIRQV